VVSVPALASPPADWPEVAAGLELLEPVAPAPEVSLPLVGPLMPLAPELLGERLGLPAAAPDAPLPVVPDAPEVSEPDAPDDGVLLEPDEEDEGLDIEEPEVLEGLVELDAPLLMPLEVELLLDELDGVALSGLAPVLELDDWARTTDDADATNTNDKFRSVVFNDMSNSLVLKLKEKHHRCSNLDTGPASAFSKTGRERTQ